MRTICLQERSFAILQDPLTLQQLQCLEAYSNQVQVHANSNGQTIIKARDYIGILVPCPSFQILIQSKFATKDLLAILNFLNKLDMDAFCAIAHLGTNSNDAQLLLCSMFVQEVERLILQHGLKKDYKFQHLSSDTIIGSIDFKKQMQKCIILPVEQQVLLFSANSMENQIVKLALQHGYAIAVKMHATELVASLFHVMHAHFGNISTIANVPSIKFTPLNEHYKHVISLAQLLLRSEALVLQRPANSAVPMKERYFYMPVLFEELVKKLLAESLGSTYYIPNKKEAFPLFKGANGCEPDFVCYKYNKIAFIGDVKYKIQQYSANDLYQAVAYLKSTQSSTYWLLCANKRATNGTSLPSMVGNEKVFIEFVDASSFDSVKLSVRNIASKMLKDTIQRNK